MREGRSLGCFADTDKHKKKHKSEATIITEAEFISMSCLLFSKKVLENTSRAEQNLGPENFNSKLYRPMNFFMID